MREYKIEARASVPYAMYIKANSNEEARKIAEEKAKSYENSCLKHRHYINNKAGGTINGVNEDTDYDSWSMRVDDYGLQIESVNPVCRRPFIPNFDD